jgi:hypothetical protein
VVPESQSIYPGTTFAAYDWDLEVRSNGAGTYDFRLRRTAGSGSSTATIYISRYGYTSAFTPSTATSTVSAPTAVLSSTVINQHDNKLDLVNAAGFAATVDPSVLTAKRSYTLPNMSGTIGLVLTGTTGSIGGSALTAGACASGTASVAGATTGMSVSVSPAGGVDPTNSNALGVVWQGYVSAANTVTVKVCAPIAGTPAAAAYNVRVIQ